ncbi:hypothetical protein [Roseomonas indoligenes]|uniref:Uncharacterized protein n=1 Tax=Roseomonas indoligenes TaxID=2820811 RepID=A0A940S496_9PROT|nr:hypothetical protein [Pararoseomonas indoligenes]MBP0491770.1 hypothetical protein [Pararoseomonas indoligenes]
MTETGPAPLFLEHRPAPPWVLPGAPVFRSEILCTGLMAALPCYGGMLTTATLRGLLETQRSLHALGLPFACATVENESLIPRARNALVARFLASTASHLLFIDADIGFGADAVLRLLGHGREVIGGLYRSKRLDREEWVAGFAPGADGLVRSEPATGAVEVATIGTGFLLIRREVLTRMAEALPGTRHATDEGILHALFDTAIEPGTESSPGRYLSEDYLFCARWRGLGGTLWCDPAIRLEHRGNLGLAGDPSSLFALP